MASFQDSWPKKIHLAFCGLITNWLTLKIRLPFEIFWPFYAEMVVFEGKYYYSTLFANGFAKYFE